MNRQAKLTGKIRPSDVFAAALIWAAVLYGLSESSAQAKQQVAQISAPYCD